MVKWFEKYTTDSIAVFLKDQVYLGAQLREVCLKISALETFSSQAEIKKWR